MTRSNTNYQISMYQASVLLVNLLGAIKDSSVGFDDADLGNDYITDVLSRASLSIPRYMLESIMFASNLMNEDKKFWHPRNRNFDTFVTDVLGPNKEYNKTYGWIEDKKGDKNVR
jgi:hypothetical protein